MIVFLLSFESESIRHIFFRHEQRYVYSFLPADNQIKAIVLISHGLHEHSLRHAGIAYELVQKGFAVYSIDHYAHGKSPGKMALITDYKVLIQDFVDFAQYVQSKHPDKSTYVFSHSMGTLIGFLAANKIGNIKAILFSATPIFSGPAGSSPFGIRCLFPLTETSAAKYLTAFLSTIDPTGLAAPLFDEGLTSDPTELEKIAKDALIYHGWIMNKTAYEVIKMIDEMKAAIPDFTIPFLCVHGSDDEIAFPKGSDFIYRNTATDTAHKSMKIFQGLKHEMLYEKLPDRVECMQYCVQYFEECYNKYH